MPVLRNSHQTSWQALLSCLDSICLESQAARKTLPSLYEQLLQAFQRRGSLRMKRIDVIAAMLDMHLADGGLSQQEAGVHLEVLARAVPDWLTLSAGSAADEGSQGANGAPVQWVTIAKMCTGVRQRLEDVAHGYSFI
jgi:hypothetical protein